MDRFEKAEVIVNEYKKMEYTIPNLALKFGLSEEDLTKLLHLYNIYGRTQLTPENSDNRLIKPFINNDDLYFLDGVNL